MTVKSLKIYDRFGKFQNYIPVALWGATGLKCIFFLLQICNKVPGGKKKRGPVAPPTGDRPLSPTPRATDQWAQPTGARGLVAPPAGDRGGLSPPRGRPGQPSLYKASPLIPSSFDLKKSRKKRGVRRREATKLYRIPHL